MPYPKINMLTIDEQSWESARWIAEQCVKTGALDPTLTWVLLNFQRRSSCTLYIGSDPETAALIAEAAKKVITESFAYLLAMQTEVWNHRDLLPRIPAEVQQ
jgi:hypothetical protein